MLWCAIHKFAGTQESVQSQRCEMQWLREDWALREILQEQTEERTKGEKPTRLKEDHADRGQSVRTV